MKYTVEIIPKAVKDLKDIPKPQAQKIITAIYSMENNLAGDTKRLTNHTQNIVFASATIVSCLKLKAPEL